MFTTSKLNQETAGTSRYNARMLPIDAEVDLSKPLKALRYGHLHQLWPSDRIHSCQQEKVVLYRHGARILRAHGKHRSVRKLARIPVCSSNWNESCHHIVIRWDVHTLAFTVFIGLSSTKKKQKKYRRTVLTCLLFQNEKARRVFGLNSKIAGFSRSATI